MAAQLLTRPRHQISLLHPRTPFHRCKQDILERPAQVRHLLTNHRAHGGITRLAHWGMLEVLTHFFPDALDRLPPETSSLTGMSHGSGRAAATAHNPSIQAFPAPAFLMCQRLHRLLANSQEVCIQQLACRLQLQFAQLKQVWGAVTSVGCECVCACGPCTLLHAHAGPAPLVLLRACGTLSNLLFGSTSQAQAQSASARAGDADAVVIVPNEVPCCACTCTSPHSVPVAGSLHACMHASMCYPRMRASDQALWTRRVMDSESDSNSPISMDDGSGLAFSTSPLATLIAGMQLNAWYYRLVLNLK